MKLFLPDKFSPLREQNFRYYIIARFFYIMALRMLTTVAGYKLFQLTQDTYAVGFAGLAEFIPVFSLALYAGHIIDQSDKRTLLLKSILSYSLCLGGMIFINNPFLVGAVNKHTSAAVSILNMVCNSPFSLMRSWLDFEPSQTCAAVTRNLYCDTLTTKPVP